MHALAGRQHGHDDGSWPCDRWGGVAVQEAEQVNDDNEEASQCSAGTTAATVRRHHVHHWLCSTLIAGPTDEYFAPSCCANCQVSRLACFYLSVCPQAYINNWNTAVFTVCIVSCRVSLLWSENAFLCHCLGFLGSWGCWSPGWLKIGDSVWTIKIPFRISQFDLVSRALGLPIERFTFLQRCHA